MAVEKSILYYRLEEPILYYFRGHGGSDIMLKIFFEGRGPVAQCRHDCVNLTVLSPKLCHRRHHDK